MTITARVYAVEFHPVGKLHYFSHEGELSRGQKVLGTSFFGLEVGTVVWGPREMDLESEKIEVKPLLRPLSEEDFQTEERNRKDAQQAFEVCKQKIVSLKLPMKLLQAVYMFDRSKLLFYFSADGRVDFRELVKVLAHTFRIRIELRQVGVRDELKFVGALGLCGQPVCCKRFLREFDTITLRDAKKQQLMINPSKISGQCRRLLCCLKYEVEAYEELMRGIPGQGAIIEYEDKVCKVLNSNVFTRIVTVQSDAGQTVTIPFSHFLKKKTKVLKEMEENPLTSAEDESEMREITKK